MNKFFVLVFVVGVYGRVTVKDEEISNFKTLDDNNIIHNEGHVKDNAKKTCLHELDVDNNIDSDDLQPCIPELKVDNGTALILTPYIEEGRIGEARNASMVDPETFLGFESYSGFLTVDKEYKSHLFFWYFPALKPTNDTPWMIWLQGGPGASSMTGLFDEIGPFKVELDGTLQRNPYSWVTNHSLVFIDNPVGTGYSYTEHSDGYSTDMATYSRHLYLATKQLVQIFPELRVAPLYIAGESYAGKYVPSLGMEIHKRKNVPGSDINLKGLIIGNAYVEPDMISEVVRPFYHFGLLEKEQIELVQPLIDAFQSDIHANKSVEAKEKWGNLIVAFLTMAHQKHAYNFLRDDLSVGYYIQFLSKTEVKRALHVGDIRFSFVNVTANIKLAPDFLSNAKPIFEELLEHYRVLAYCGQLDQMLPCAFSSDSYRKWKWSGSSDFLKATREPFIHNRKLVGYHKSGGGLTWSVIRGAGHMVPLDAPEPIRQLVTLWTHSKPLPALSRRTNVTVMVQSLIQNYTMVYL